MNFYEEQEIAPYNPVPYEYTLQDRGIYGSYVNWLKYGPFPPQGEWAGTAHNFKLIHPMELIQFQQKLNMIGRALARPSEAGKAGYPAEPGYSYAEGFDDHAYNKY